jgi:hypothetical protein
MAFVHDSLPTADSSRAHDLRTVLALIAGYETAPSFSRPRGPTRCATAARKVLALKSMAYLNCKIEPALYCKSVLAELNEF